MFANRRSAFSRASGPPRGRRSQSWAVMTWKVLFIGLGAVTSAHADPTLVLPSGLPVQVKPTFQEPGLPAFSFPVGGSSSLGGSSSSVGDSGGSGGGGGGSSGSGDAYNTMMSQSWGSAAADAASAMGVSATALAATCVMESNCQNVGSSSGSTAAGAFQMINSTYTADINGAVAYNPDIAGSVISRLAGQMDPTTEAYAASYELRSDALALQSDGISDPTVLQARAMYQFGASVGPDVAAASDSDNISDITGLSAASLAANGLTASSTVGDWRKSIINKLGASTANQTVLSGN
jgi:hypothetical protein